MDSGETTREGWVEIAGVEVPADSVFADYATRGLDNEQVSLAVAGGTGVALTLVVGWGLGSAYRRLRPSTAAPS